MSFATDIKEIRMKCLLSQEEFANVLGVSFTTVNRWEKSKSKPNYKAMKKINEYCKKHKLGYDVSEGLLEDK